MEYIHLRFFLHIEKDTVSDVHWNENIANALIEYAACLTKNLYGSDGLPDIHFCENGVKITAVGGARYTETC